MSKNGGPRKRPPPFQQRDTIKPYLQERELKLADTYYVISIKWFNKWKEYVHFNHESGSSGAAVEERESTNDDERKPPNSIDNSVILEDPSFKAKGNEPVIKAKAIEGVDFLLLPASAWAYLYKWYGGGPELPREVIGDGKEGKQLRVEVFPLALTFKNTNTEGHINPFSAIEVVVSKKATVSYLKGLVCRKMELDPAHARIWNYAKTTGKLIKEENVTLEEAKLIDGQSLLVEVRLDDGAWPRDTLKRRNSVSGVRDRLSEGKRGGSLMLASTLNNMKALLGISDEYQTSASRKYYQHQASSGAAGQRSAGAGGGGIYSGSSSGDIKAQAGASKGVCGLVNLGNTCFLNSAVQCLSNTVQLTEFFLSDAYKADVNKSNPLGMKGQLAECYGALLKRLWSGDYSAVAPRNLKRCIGKYAPQFNGFSQHDAQEFLAFLLDGLHEDLNRVLHKPYVEIKESDGRADEEVSREAWDAHLKRNRSVIVDLFQGQLKSTVMCPEAKCGKVSITFDPFMYISLPMPPESDRLVEVILVPQDPQRKPVMYSIKCAKSARVQFLKEKLAEYSGVAKRRIALVDIEDHYIHGFIPDARSVATFRSNATAFAFETPGPVDPKQALRLQVLHRRVNPAFLNSPKYSADPANARKVPRQPFGMPFMLFVSAKRTTGRQLYTLVWHHLARFMKQDITRPCGSSPSPASSGEKEKDKHKDNDDERDESRQAATGEDGPHAAVKEPNGIADSEASAARVLLPVAQGEGTSPSHDNKNKNTTTTNINVNVNVTDDEEEDSAGGRKAKEAQGHSNGGSGTYTDTTEGVSLSDERLMVPVASTSSVTSAVSTLSVTATTVSTDMDKAKEVEDDGSRRGRDHHHQHAPASMASRSTTSTSTLSSTSSSTVSTPTSSMAGEAVLEWPPELGFTLDWERLPFRLSYVGQNGSACGRCSGYSGTCTGCSIRPDDEPVKFKQVTLPSIAIDWDPKLVRDFLALDKAGEVEDHESVAANKKRAHRRLSLDDCFRLFCMNEQLGEDDQWYCPSCKDFRQARKKFELWKMPQTLVIHLKRFQYTRFSRDKIITFCDFPLTGLDLSEYVQGSNCDVVYDLYAVANHQGGLGGGHYTAFGLNALDDRWYHFNDGTATAVSEEAVRTSAAYVLFYKLRSPAGPGDDAPPPPLSSPSGKKRGSSSNSSSSSSKEKGIRDKATVKRSTKGNKKGEEEEEEDTLDGNGKSKKGKKKKNAKMRTKEEEDSGSAPSSSSSLSPSTTTKSSSSSAEAESAPLQFGGSSSSSNSNGVVMAVGKEKNASRTESGQEVVTVVQTSLPLVEDKSSSSNGVAPASSLSSSASKQHGTKKKSQKANNNTSNKKQIAPEEDDDHLSSSPSHVAKKKKKEDKDKKKKKDKKEGKLRKKVDGNDSTQERGLAQETAARHHHLA